MKDIKFRAYHKKENRIFKVIMMDWFVASGSISQKEQGNIPTYFKLERDRLDEDGKFVETLELDNVFLNEIEIMQFTGLKDKNNKEIYEGDIVRFYPYELSKHKHKRGLLIKGKIVFNDNSQFCIRYIDMFEPEVETDYLFRKECEVIGNIYENPDLLTFQKEKETNSG